MEEIEAKILNIDLDDVITKLIKLGAKKEFDSIIKAQYYDFPDNSLKSESIQVRLRSIDNQVYLTTKTKIYEENQDYKLEKNKPKKIKIRQENEIIVSDFYETDKILNVIGLRKYREIKKHRISYSLDNIHFDIDKYLDEYNFIPWFIEIEAPTIYDVIKYANKLGFNKDQLKSFDFFDLVNYYKDNKK